MKKATPPISPISPLKRDFMSRKTNQGHTQGQNVAQTSATKGARIRKNQSELIRFRLPWSVFLTYRENAEKSEIGSVALFCKKICAEWWPSMREYRIQAAMEQLKRAEQLRFTKEEMSEAQRRLLKV